MEISTSKNSEFIKTLNQMGYMSAAPDPYSQEFIELCGNLKVPVLEIGTAYGVSTIPALEKGAYVIANDLDIRHLEILKQKVSSSLHKRLELKPGRFPEEISFDDNVFGAILACRVLHLITPAKLKSSVSLFYRWLQPGGKLFIIADTPYLRFIKDFIPIYEERLKRGLKWPGWIPNLPFFLRGRHSDVPTWANFLDVPVLKRIFEQSKFIIEKIGYIARDDFPEDVRLDGRESVGIILFKPLHDN